MNQRIIIRPEAVSDYDAIAEITIAAFANEPHSVHTEQFIIRALRKANALTLSLVAELDGRVVGHIAFSPATISDGSQNWYGIGPLSVTPELQRQGIGGSLLLEGMRQLKARGAEGCVLVGDPGYYVRFGFRNLPALRLEGVPPENFMALPFAEMNARGNVDFHEAFFAQS